MRSSTDTCAARKRPASLREVADLGRALGEPDGFLREFLDEFYRETGPANRQSMIADEPPVSDRPRVDAYLSATSEA